MSYYINDKVVRTLPEQVAQNQEDIAALQNTQKTDESSINTNLNNINAHETRINALESLKMTQDGQNIKLTKSTGEIGNIAVGTVGGTNLLGGNNVTFKTINGESITGYGNLTVDTDLSALLWANLGIGRWASQTLYGLSWDASGSTFIDALMPRYTNYIRFMANTGWENRDSGTVYHADMTFNLDFNTSGYYNFELAFARTTCESIELPNMNASSLFLAFSDSPYLKKVTIKQGCSVKAKSILYAFAYCPELTEIGAIDLSTMTVAYGLDHFIYASPKVKSIHCKHFKVPFDISPSTAFEESDLVEIISNLDTVSNGAVLTMGTTNLNKLTIDEIAVATGKGWTLA